MADAVTTGADTPSAQAPASAPERLDFLKQVVGFNEANVRAYDVKAQISLAAFVLSANPLVTIVNSTCGHEAARNVLVITLIVFVLTILSYLWVLWPTSPPRERLTSGLSAQDLFYVRDPLKLGGVAYTDRLKTLALEPELTAEALKLSYIRRAKSLRFKFALITTLFAYIVVAASYFAVSRCAF